MLAKMTANIGTIYLKKIRKKFNFGFQSIILFTDILRTECIYLTASE